MILWQNVVDEKCAFLDLKRKWCLLADTGKFVSRNGIDFPNFDIFYSDVLCCIKRIVERF